MQDKQGLLDKIKSVPNLQSYEQIQQFGDLFVDNEFMATTHKNIPKMTLTQFVSEAGQRYFGSLQGLIVMFSSREQCAQSQ